MAAEVPTFTTAVEEAAFWKKKAEDLKTSLEEAREELEEFQLSSRELESELEAQLVQQEAKSADLRQQLNKVSLENEALRERVEKQQKEFSTQVSVLQQELAEIKHLKDDLARYIRELEQANDDLERGKRATVCSLEDFESRLNLAIERNAFLESELDDKESLKAMVQRLKDESRDLRQEINIRNRVDDKDNDRALQHAIEQNQRQEKKQQTQNLQQHRRQAGVIDSNKLITESGSNDSLSDTTVKSHTLNSVNNGTVPGVPPSRVTALNIVGELLRKVGALESRLASCRTLVKDSQRPLGVPSGNHSAR